MNRDRRTFLASGLAAASIAGSSSPVLAQEPARVDGLTCVDYGRSFICNTANFNRVRFWVESRTILIDGETRTEFYQCGSCKSENTFGEKDLLYADNYDFLPILGERHWLVFRRTARLNPNYRSIKKVEELWGPPLVKLREAKEVAVLDTWEKIRDLSAAAAPIISRTELADEQTGLKAIIEAPVKTLNISIDKSMYQVDTGPVGYPDLSQRFEPRVDCLKLAFVAFNASHFADFVVEQPTLVMEGEREKCQIHHYSSPFSKPAKNTLLAVEDA
jgi:hypothetical protein